MKTSLWCAAALALFLATAPPLRAEQFPLKAMDIPDTSNEVAAMACREISGQDMAAPGAGTLAAAGARSGISHARFETKIGGSDVVMALDYAQTGARLFVAASAADLPKSAPLVGHYNAAKRFVFPAFPLTGADGTKLMVRAEAVGPYLLAIFPASILSGTATLEGKQYRLFVADGNLNGAFNDAFAGNPSEAGGTYDVLAVDMNGNKKLDPEVNGFAEVMPLPKRVCLGGAWYAVTVAADGSNIDLTKVEVGTGTIRATADAVDVALWSESGGFRLCGTHNKVTVPVGTYYPIHSQLTKRDANGGIWTLQGYLGSVVKPLEVTKDAETTIDVGPPLVIKVDIAKGQNNYLSLGCSIFGKGGESYASGATRNGVKQPAPHLRIFDESGKLLAAASWSYG